MVTGLFGRGGKGRMRTIGTQVVRTVTRRVMVIRLKAHLLSKKLEDLRPVG